MRSRSVRNSLLTFLLIAIAASPGGCGRSEAPADRTPEKNAPVGFVPDTKPVPEARWADATVPSGTPIKLSLIDILTSQTSRKEDPFRALVTDAIVIDGAVTVPSGSNVRGVVKEVVPGDIGYKGRGGMIALEFNRIDTPTGASAPLQGRLTELAPQKSSAVLVGRAAPGVIAAAAQGREVVLESGSPMTLVLEAPLHIKVRQ
jgi:hypothetical protein